MQRTYWLKSVDSSDDQQADGRADAAAQEQRHVHFADKGKPKVQPGDYLVYYASSHERIIGIAEVFTPPTKDTTEGRWPWRCEIRPRIILNRIHQSPSLDVMNGPDRDFRLSVRRRSHVQLTGDEYLRARKALEAVFDSESGDRFYPWPMFETGISA